MANRFSYGGQAVIEGVMMRGRAGMSVAVRRKDGRIVSKEDPIEPLARRFPFLIWPLVRGVVALVESMALGMRALNYSAQQFAEDDGDEGESGEMSRGQVAVTMGVSFLFTIVLFIVFPAFVVRLVQAHIGSNIVLNLIEGGVKISLFLAYIAAIGLMADMRRVFQYHGAEHKAINCFEAGLPLTVENVLAQTKIHKRCGTSFIIFVLLISILLFSFFGRPPFVWRVLLHLALLPVVAAISYEILKQAGRQGAAFVFDWISRPGMWTQALTTREPDAAQAEVAIQALNDVLVLDAKDAERAGVRAIGLASSSAG